MAPQRKCYRRNQCVRVPCARVCVCVLALNQQLVASICGHYCFTTATGTKTRPKQSPTTRRNHCQLTRWQREFGRRRRGQMAASSTQHVCGHATHKVGEMQNSCHTTSCNRCGSCCDLIFDYLRDFRVKFARKINCSHSLLAFSGSVRFEWSVLGIFVWEERKKERE